MIDLRSLGLKAMVLLKIAVLGLGLMLEVILVGRMGRSISRQTLGQVEAEISPIVLGQIALLEVALAVLAVGVVEVLLLIRLRVVAVVVQDNNC